jgi:anti-anti-sigma regulatory factor
VQRPEQLEAFARYEHLVDRYMTVSPFSALCGYNRGDLGPDRVAQMACLHPVVNEGAAPFRLHASDRAAVALGGELDLSTVELFPLALERAQVRPTGGEIVVDAAGLTFVDHGNLVALDRYAQRSGATAVLRTRLHSAARIVEICRLTGVRVEPAG